MHSVVVQAYRRVLEHVKTVTGLPESRLLDVRGNHDTFNVPSRCPHMSLVPEVRHAEARTAMCTQPEVRLRWRDRHRLDVHAVVCHQTSLSYHYDPQLCSIAVAVHTDLSCCGFSRPCFAQSERISDRVCDARCCVQAW